MRKQDYLFSQYQLSDYLRIKKGHMIKEIENINENHLLNTNPEDWADYFEKKFNIDTLQLKEDQITIDQHETQVDVSQDPLRAIYDRSKPFYIKGTTIRFFIPFDGDPDLFKCRPDTFTSIIPVGTVGQGELILIYTVTNHDVSSIKSAFERDMRNIQQYLGWVNEMVSKYNASLRNEALVHIRKRREKLLKDRNLVASLGFPLRLRDDLPSTYVVPTVRKKVTLQLPKASTDPFVPEPVLDMKDYEHILHVITNMVTVMERSPQAFKGMKEEDLRHQLLVPLNGQYEGQATGETFNFEGKTDILIRIQGKNIFIAECKFWRGAEHFKKSIDQLLSYASWRDTKTALIVFNRNKNFTNVLSQIQKVVKEHPNFKREIPYQFDTGYRYILSHRDDPNRDLILTVLAFEVPK